MNHQGKKPSKTFKKQTKRAFHAMDALDFSEFLCYLRSPWRIAWTNFLAGIFRGLGILLGMTVVLGFIITILAKLSFFPIMGEYFVDLKEVLEHISEFGFVKEGVR